MTYDPKPFGQESGSDPMASDQDPIGGDASDVTAATGARAANIFWATMAGVLVIAILLMFSGGLDTMARGFMQYFQPPGTYVDLEAETASGMQGMIVFEDLDIHPDVLFRPYTAGQIIGTDVSTTSNRIIGEFRALLDLYAERQGEDDNFTIRVVDNRTDELLEIYTLEEEREAFESRSGSGTWDWGRVDRARREVTSDLVDRYSDNERPRDAVTVKWGRRNQVMEAREREREYVEYEVRLARYLGMSLLVTEIGTVETFNDDRLVSPVGARSRYQMMPYILRQNDVRHFRIAAAAGNAIDVYEEWHPLLTMEPAFATAAGYRNAVGHEIPGLSAYHTGPGNIYMVFRMFLTAGSDLFTPESTVMDAYMWALTTGYETVSRNSSFGSYSRGYIPSAYGALRATQSEPIDSTETIEAERVQIRDGNVIYLSELLRTLEQSEAPLDWGPGTDEMTAFDRFRNLNGHFDLPGGRDVGSGVRPAADIRFSDESQGAPVRFFLPLGASKVLVDAGLDVIDDRATFRYTHDTYGTPDPGEVSIWDQRYKELIDDIGQFGFNNENRRRLAVIVDQFEDLAESNPTHYRRMQLDVIRTHERIWGSEVFNRLASAVSAARGRLSFDPLPPTPLP